MSRKWVRKTTASPNAPQSAAAPSIAVLRESEDSHRFSTSAACHVLLHPIALRRGTHLTFLSGGSIVSSLRLVVMMSCNMLLFEWKELLRFGSRRQHSAVSLALN